MLIYFRSVYFVKLNFFYNKRIAEKKGIKTMYKILVADDEQKIREVIKEYAEYEGHTVYEAVDGMQAVDMAKEQDFDIIIMDVMMPRLDGFSACKEIRKFKNTPILMLSARTEEYDKLFGFEMGVDDYVVKPFSPKEVLARINAIIKRNKSGNEPAGETVKFEGLEINFTARDVFIDGEKANLVVVCGKNAVAKGAHAGKIAGKVAALTGGKGGGRPDSAMAGIGDRFKIDEALDKVNEIVGEFVK